MNAFYRTTPLLRLSRQVSQSVESAISLRYAARPLPPTLPPVPRARPAGGRLSKAVLVSKTVHDHATRRSDESQNLVMKTGWLAARCAVSHRSGHISPIPRTNLTQFAIPGSSSASASTAASFAPIRGRRGCRLHLRPDFLASRAFSRPTHVRACSRRRNSRSQTRLRRPAARASGNSTRKHSSSGLPVPASPSHNVPGHCPVRPQAALRQDGRRIRRARGGRRAGGRPAVS